jgi:hypothetical protein
MEEEGNESLQKHAVRRNTEALARNICCREKLVKYYFSQECVCILALVIRHASRIFPQSYYLSSVACLALFVYISNKRHDFRKKL